MEFEFFIITTVGSTGTLLSSKKSVFHTMILRDSNNHSSLFPSKTNFVTVNLHSPVKTTPSRPIAQYTAVINPLCTPLIHTSREPWKFQHRLLLACLLAPAGEQPSIPSDARKLFTSRDVVPRIPNIYSPRARSILQNESGIRVYGAKCI